jgi:hypothetical protein
MTDKTKEFIDKAIEVHGDKYDYSKVNYIDNLTRITIICDKHGEFYQIPKVHKTGSGCNTCENEKTRNSKKSNNNEFIEKAKKVHGDKYDYTKVDYINNRTKVKIICNKHADFEQTPNGHLDGKGNY